jgi:hypothetical protein
MGAWVPDAILFRLCQPLDLHKSSLSTKKHTVASVSQEVMPRTHTGMILLLVRQAVTHSRAGNRHLAAMAGTGEQVAL